MITEILILILFIISLGSFIIYLHCIRMARWYREKQETFDNIRKDLDNPKYDMIRDEIVKDSKYIRTHYEQLHPKPTTFFLKG